MRMTRWLLLSPRRTKPKSFVSRCFHAGKTALEVLEDRTTPVVGALAPATAVTLGIFDPLAAAGSSSSGIVAVISPTGGLGTGELLTTGRDILTAAHVVTQGTAGDVNDPLVVKSGFFKIVFYVPQEVDIFVPSSSIVVNPGWTGNVDQGNDLAIIQLPTQAPAAASRYPLFTGATEVGQTFTIVGFGRSGNGTMGNDGSQPLGKSGSMRFAVNTYDQTDQVFKLAAPPRPPLPPGSDVPAATFPPNSALVYDFDKAPGTNDALDFFFGIKGADLGAKEGFAAQGDSGGPGFIGNAIASVVSYGFGFPGQPDILPGTNNSFGEIEVDTRVSAFAGWISTVININRLQVTITPTVTAGTPFDITVTAVNALGMAIPGYLGTISFSTSDTKGIAAGTAALPPIYTFNAADKGRHVFPVAAPVTTLTTSGVQSITATDTTTPAITGFDVTNVNAEVTTVLSVTAGSNINPFVPLPDIPGAGGVVGPTGVGTTPVVQVVARDRFGNQTPNYTGTVAFTSTDGAAIIPPNYTFNGIDAGKHIFFGAAAVKFMTAGDRTIRARDTVTAAITGVTTVRVTAAGTAVRLLVNTPRATAGVPFITTVQAVDVFGDIAPNYAGTVRLTTDDPAAAPPVVMPGTHKFDPAKDFGTFTFTGVILVTAGTQTITATDTVTATITGNAPVTVVPAATSRFLVQLDPVSAVNVVPNKAFDILVGAVDRFGNLTPTYNGTVHFTTNDPAAAGVIVPGDYKFTVGATGVADNGIHRFPAGVTLVTAGARTITATDTVVAATNGAANVTVGAPVFRALKIVSAADPVTAGTAFVLTVTAQDLLGNTVETYVGTVSFTSSDTKGAVVLPAPPYKYVAADKGAHDFAGVILATAGKQTITVRDTATGIRSTVTIMVNPAATSTLVVTPVSTLVLQGVPSSVTVTAQDRFGNVTPAYTGTVAITSGDGKAVKPPNYPFTALDKGIHTFAAPTAVTFNTLGAQTVTATDSKNAAITGVGNVNVVAPTAVASLQVTILAPLPSTIRGLNAVLTGKPVSLVVTALDANGFVVPYTGTVTFTSTDKNAAVKLPPNYKFVAGDMGSHTFTGIILVTRARTTVTVADANTAAIKGSDTCIVQ